MRYSHLANDIWELMLDYIPHEHRRVVAEELVGIFDDYDLDISEATDLLDDAGIDD